MNVELVREREGKNNNWWRWSRVVFRHLYRIALLVDNFQVQLGYITTTTIIVRHHDACICTVL